MSVALIHFRSLCALIITVLEEAEIIPGKYPDTRIKPLALTNDHGRYITVILGGVYGFFRSWSFRPPGTQVGANERAQFSKKFGPI
jgi:hypothetical protein